MARPSKIVCVGKNYVEHAREFDGELPERPLLFLKAPSAVIGDGDDIELPPDSERVDHEAEIAFVIGRRARDVAASEALDVIAGYAPLNDVTARDLQRIDNQWARAKGFDTFCPIGPTVDAGEVDWRDLEIVARVNGEERQRGAATQMAWGIPELVAYVSRIMTLEPGDVIATGTPEGVAPLQPGDEVEIELVGLASVSNPVTSAA